MIELFSQPWPWWVAGPMIGAMVPILLLAGNRHFGVSNNLRHVCAAVFPSRKGYLAYDWRGTGLWNLAFALGIVLGGFLAATFLPSGQPTPVSPATQADLAALGVTRLDGLVPSQLFDWSQLLTVPGLVLMVLGGFLIGFGTSYAGGCSSGHGVAGLADLQPASLLAVVAFFIGGLLATWLLLPLLLRGWP